MYTQHEPGAAKIAFEILLMRPPIIVNGIGEDRELRVGNLFFDTDTAEITDLLFRVNRMFWSLGAGESLRNRDIIKAGRNSNEDRFAELLFVKKAHMDNALL